MFLYPVLVKTSIHLCWRGLAVRALKYPRWPWQLKQKTHGRNVRASMGTNVLYVRSDKQLNEVQVIDLTGRVLLQINGRQQLVKLNISGFAPGMYIVRVNRDFSVKLVKE